MAASSPRPLPLASSSHDVLSIRGNARHPPVRQLFARMLHGPEHRPSSGRPRRPSTAPSHLGGAPRRRVNYGPCLSHLEEQLRQVVSDKEAEGGQLGQPPSA